MKPSASTTVLEFPLTPAQMRMWAGQAMQPHAPLYNMALAWRIEGDLSENAFVTAFAQLVDEADALRTVLIEAGDAPLQRVLPAADPCLEVVDLRGEPDAALEAMQARCGHVFDLTRRSFDAALYRVGDSAWYWFYNQHHIFTDAGSFAVLFRRMAELYRCALGETSEGSVLGRFADRASIDGRSRALEAAERHFAERQGVPPRPYGRRRFEPTTRSDRVPSLNVEDTRALRALAREKPWASLTPQMAEYQIFATLFLAFLARISSQADVAFGAPVHNRTTPEDRRTAGLLIDLLPTGVSLDPGETFLSLHAKVRAETGLFLRHATSGLDSSPFQGAVGAVLNFITASFGDFAGMPCSSRWLHSGHADPTHHLRLQVEDFDGTGLNAFLDVNRAAMPSPAAVAGHFRALCRGFLNDPGQPIDAVSLLSEDEERGLDPICRGPERPVRAEPVSEVFARIATRHPDDVAIDGPDGALTYEALLSRVDALAGALQARGVTAGSRVALVLPLSAAAVVAMLAVLRCGATYVPIDLKQPEKRRRFIFSDSGCRLAVGLSPGPETVVVGRDGDCQGAPYRPVHVRAEDAVYLLYTSGSTGKPKGVVISNGALAHYTGWAADTYCGGDAKSFALFTPLTFDLTVTSIFVPLTTGGTIRIYPQSEGELDLSVLDVMAGDVVDIVKLTPAHLRMILGHARRTSRIRQLIVGGEDLPAALAQNVHSAFGGKVAIHNEYGPTEATVGCMIHHFDPEKDRVGSVPIGAPIENMTARVLNAAGLPEPVGVVGELVLSGAGLADGYHARADLTASAFLHGKDGWAYRTGDLARIREDGVIEYLGRHDNQVKVNGVRVETGEVEAALSAVPGVEAAAVVLSSSAATRRSVVHCRLCGLASDFPDARINADDVCSICEEFSAYRDSAQDYFRTMARLRERLGARLPSRGTHDAVVLLSGGKDSTYMLGRLVEMGLNCLAFTLDNGFISNQAKANIDRVVDALGVTHLYGTVPGMNTIFADSLARHSNVCNGCFKTIYTLGMQLAFERKIPFLFTGLSRGQLFETRLTPELFAKGAPSACEIDAMVTEARKAYHRSEDAVSENLDTKCFGDDEIFEAVEVVDFYRYCDVGLTELYAWLDQRLPWVRPSDTGRSTNCRVNDVGIYVHKLERGFHNYALPYSWDVRMGHKDRAASLAELDDVLDEAEIERMLDQIGYSPKEPEAPPPCLVAYVVGDVAEDELRGGLAAMLPAYMIPAQFVSLAALPLSANGKVDRAALPPPPPPHSRAAGEHVAPRTEAEREMARIWQDVLGHVAIGVTDNFFDLGGDSIAALRINVRARAAGLDLRPNDLFEALTIERLTALAQSRSPKAEQVVAPGPVPLMAAQAWYLRGFEECPPGEAQVLRFKLPRRASREELTGALMQLVAHHDGLRTAFEFSCAGWTAQVLEDPPDPLVCSEGSVADLAQALDPVRAANVAALLKDREVTLVVHHLVIDAASWPVLLEDLDTILDGRALPRKTTSIREWASSTPQDLRTTGQATKSTVAELCHTSRTVSRRTLESLRRDLRIQNLSLEQKLVEIAGKAIGVPIRVVVEKEGRDGPDGRLNAGRTIGWFTQFETRMIAASDGGAGQMREAPEDATVLFNLMQAPEDVPGNIVPQGRLELWRAPNAPVRQGLTINAVLAKDGLTIDWDYLGCQDDLDRMADAFVGVLGDTAARSPVAQAEPAARATTRQNLGKLAALLGKQRT